MVLIMRIHETTFAEEGFAVLAQILVDFRMETRIFATFGTFLCSIPYG